MSDAALWLLFGIAWGPIVPVELIMPPKQVDVEIEPFTGFDFPYNEEQV